MTGSAQQADVEIFGKTYTLVSDRSSDYAREVAEEVTQRMERIAAEKNLADTTKIAMMVAMEIADELVRTRQAGQDRLDATETAGERLKTTIREADG
ncbi:MAG: cell division protein ZapA [Gemmatimonadetes bacterium]|nr:cell division protein ZapA [Gemmatimonadota bacterium]